MTPSLVHDRTLGSVLRSGCLVIALLVAGCTSSDAGSTRDTVDAEDDASVASDSGFDVVLTDVSELVDAVSDGVVAVSQGQFRFEVEDLLQSVLVRAGVGTGIVIDDDGHILTNYHVIAGAEVVTVTLRNGDERVATVIGEAPDFDLALLAVGDSSGLEPIPFGSSDELEVGDPVVAIGNALGLDETAPTVSVGIVSARGRTLEAENGTILQGLLQTDAAINPGNSGGPLLNRDGALVGINTAIVGGAQNLGFAIAIDGATGVIDEFLSGQGGPFIGVRLTDNSPQLATQLRLATDRGAIVAAVTSGPGLTAGLRPGDVVVGVDGAVIDSARDLIATIAISTPGTDLTLDVVRGLERLDIVVSVGQRPALVG
jgi:S1-C subfamily serine protease